MTGGIAVAGLDISFAIDAVRASRAGRTDMPPRNWRQASAQFDPILVLAAQRTIAITVGEMLRGFGPHGSISWVTSNEDALRMVAGIKPKLIFVEQTGLGIDGLKFVRDLRQGGLPGKAAPVILMSDERSVSALRAAQNAGAHEFLVRPFSADHLLKRLDAVASEPRPWFETASYAGPDRRRFNTATTPVGQNRRKVVTS